MCNIKKVKPYFIKKVHSDDEFTNLQNELFLNDYKWLSGKIISNDFVKLMCGYPIYVSNLPFMDTEFCNKNRISHNEFNNNILFVSKHKDEFDLLFLRIEKLIHINENF